MLAKPSIEPKRWKAPLAPARAKQKTGTHLLGPITRIPLTGHGPEDVVVDDDGRIYTGLEDGRIVRVDGDRIDTIAHTGGRPLGLELLPEARLLVCDPFRGLLGVDIASGRIQTLATGMKFASNVAAAADGTIYFTDSSQIVGFDHNVAEVYAHSCTGRLLKLAPGGRPEVLLDGLAFANGLTLAPDESFALVVETFEYRVTRLWLSGPRAGQSEPLLENLPGIPDNMSTGADGLFWIALSIPRNDHLDRLLRLPGVLRRAIYQLPESIAIQPPQTLWVIAVDGEGAIHYDLQTDGCDYALVTGLTERDSRVYLASFQQPVLASFDLADLIAVNAR